MAVLNPTRGVYSVLGCICNNVELLRQPTIILKERDFYKNLDKIIFSAIYNIAFSDYEIKRITAIDIDNYLAQYKKLYKIYEQYNGYKYISSAIEQSNIETFGVSYHRVKMFSLLRHYKENGFDITDLFNPDEDDFQKIDDAIKKLDNMSEDEVVEYFTLKAIGVRDSWDKHSESEGFKVGDRVSNVVARLGESPVYGSPYYYNKYFNTIFKGKLKGRMMLIGGNSGDGKSRALMSDAVESSCSQIYDFEKRRWIDLNVNEPTLYISSELDEQEVITIMLAHISGVSQGILEKGVQYWSNETRDRIYKAQEILEQAPLFIEVIEDFSIMDIQMLVEKYIVQENICNCYFDYVKICASMTRNIKEVYGSDMKTWQILARFTDQLKTEIVNKYQIYLETACQLNRDTESFDGSRLEGSRAMQNMIDHGKLVFSVNDKILKLVEKQLKANPQFQSPNYAHFIFKNRKGLKNIIVWTKMNLGNYREEVCFISDYMGNILTDIKPTDIQIDGGINEVNIDF